MPNDKLQIRDLIAMLTAPGIDPSAYIEVGAEDSSGPVLGIRKNKAMFYEIQTELPPSQIALDEASETGRKEGLECGWDNAQSNFCEAIKNLKNPYAHED